MLIALLVTLGVDLVVGVVFVAAVLSCMRWVSHQPRAIRGAMAVAGGEVDGVGAKCRPRYGRRVSGVLVRTKAPFVFRNELATIDALN
jgi:hypothetical protein